MVLNLERSTGSGVAVAGAVIITAAEVAAEGMRDATSIVGTIVHMAMMMSAIAVGLAVIMPEGHPVLLRPLLKPHPLQQLQQSAHLSFLLVQL